MTDTKRTPMQWVDAIYWRDPQSYGPDVVGIALAAISAVVNLAAIATYPMWAVVVILLDVAVIFALATNRRGAPG